MGYNGFILQMTGNEPIISFDDRGPLRRGLGRFGVDPQDRPCPHGHEAGHWADLGRSGQTQNGAESAVDVVCCHCSIFVCNLMNIYNIYIYIYMVTPPLRPPNVSFVLLFTA